MEFRVTLSDDANLEMVKGDTPESMALVGFKAMLEYLRMPKVNFKVEVLNPDYSVGREHNVALSGPELLQLVKDFVS